MPRDFWQTFRQALRVNKLNKYITLPAFSERAFRSKGCLYADPTVSPVGNETITIAYETEYSLEFWCKTSSPNTNSAVSLFAATAAPDFEILFEMEGPLLYLRFNSFFENIEILCSKSINFTQWNHVACTFVFKTGVPDGVLNVYVNTELIGTSAIITTAMPGTAEFYLFPFGGNVLSFFGYFGEIRTWHKALTQDEILYLYNKPLGESGIAPNTVYTDLNDYYPLNIAANQIYFGAGLGSVLQALIWVIHFHQMLL